MPGKSIQLPFGIVRDKSKEKSIKLNLPPNGVLKDSIQDSLGIIVADGKFNDASIRRALDTKYPSVIKKSNPIDVAFKDKAKFYSQKPIIGTLLAQIQSGKTNEKTTERQLKGAPSIKDLNIAEQLERLKQFDRKK